MPSRVASGSTARARSRAAPSKAGKGSLGGPVIAPALKRKDAFDSAERGSDGSLSLGRREAGLGEVVLSNTGELLLDGQKGPAAALETARLIELGLFPFANATEEQRAQLVKTLVRHIEPATVRKSSSRSVLNRSAGATLLLSLARSAEKIATREGALAEYIMLLGNETHLPLKASLLTNLDAADVPLKKAQAALVEEARHTAQPRERGDDDLGEGDTDEDMDGLAHPAPTRIHRFFDPVRRRAQGGSNHFLPAAHSVDPQTLSGAKIAHAIGYANASPPNRGNADTFVPGGWFVSEGDEPLRIAERYSDGKAWFEISVSSRHADKSREVVTSMVLYEVHKYLCDRDGHFDTDDRLRALVRVGRYLDLHADFSDTIDEVLAGFAKKYGYTGKLDYELMCRALEKDGEVGTASKKAIDYLKIHGISAG
jgi:hypothetical protein